MQVSSRSPFSDFELEILTIATLGLILPIAIILSSTWLLESMKQTRPQLRRVLFLSPWVWHCLWQFCGQIRDLAFTINSNIRNRSKALPSAVQELQNRLSNQRAYKTRRYTVYLPSQDLLKNTEITETEAAAADGATNEGIIRPTKIILFFPGALVPSEAYSQLAGRLSDNGLIVIVPSLEPCLYAAPNLGTDIQTVRRMMQNVRAELKLDPNNIQWVLGGHSMGAFGAMRLYDQFKKEERTLLYNLILGEVPIRIKDLVLIGVAPFLKECTDLSSYNDAKTNRILLIQATDDVLMKILGDGLDLLYKKFPQATTIRKDILGGTHHGFASYNDENGQITMQEQQRQVCKHVAEFLLLKK